MKAVMSTQPMGPTFCARRWRADKQLRARVNAQTELSGTVILFPAFFCLIVGLTFFGDDPDERREVVMAPIRAADPTPRVQDDGTPSGEAEEGSHIDRATGYLVPPTSLVPPLTDNDRRN